MTTLSRYKDIGQYISMDPSSKYNYVATYIAYFYFEEGVYFGKDNLNIYSGKAIAAHTDVAADDGCW